MIVSCIVQARMGSTRLPGKVLADLAGRPLLTFMLERLRGLDVEHLVVATSDLARDDPVAEAAAKAGASVVRGPEQDVLARFALAAKRHPSQVVVRLTADCPIADPAIISAAIDLQQRSGAEYVSNTLIRTFPVGLDVEVFSSETLAIAHGEAVDPSEREHVTPFIYRRPERFVLKPLRHTAPLGDLRWTVDTPEDLDFVQRIVKVARGRTDFAWESLLTAGDRSRPSVDHLQLRPAMPSDEFLTMRLRNKPGAIGFGQSRLASHAQHGAWFAAILQDPGRPLWIAHIGGTPIGIMHVEITDGVGRISVRVDSDGRHGHSAPELVALLQQEALRGQQLTALEIEVQSADAGSAKDFESAGFIRSATDRGRLLLRWQR